MHANVRFQSSIGIDSIWYPSVAFSANYKWTIIIFAISMSIDEDLFCATHTVSDIEYLTCTPLKSKPMCYAIIIF